MAKKTKKIDDANDVVPKKSRRNPVDEHVLQAKKLMAADFQRVQMEFTAFCVQEKVNEMRKEKDKKKRSSAKKKKAKKKRSKKSKKRCRSSSSSSTTTSRCRAGHGTQSERAHFDSAASVATCSCTQSGVRVRFRRTGAESAGDEAVLQRERFQRGLGRANG